MINPTPYIPGDPDSTKFLGPLQRFLPPVIPGVAETWVEQHLHPGSWVLDPFGALPNLAIEIAQAGYRVLVPVNNPVNRFLLEMLSTPPSEDELRAALAHLSTSRKGDERLEPHILSLYTTRCDNCRQEIPAEAFLWERDAVTPYARIYRCAHCDDARQSPVTQEDIERSAEYSQNSRLTLLHRARALERVAPLNDPDREHVEKAIEAYPPRAVYALFTLINKLDGITLSEHERALVNALLISTFDTTNTLHPYPPSRWRYKMLSTPPRYRENNVWFALENAVKEWSSDNQLATPLTLFPHIPSSGGGICLYQGRIKSLVPDLKNLEIAEPMDISAVMAAVPRPNQAFWTLSALWAGWLWGPQAMGPFKSVLRRRRYSWHWHTAALSAALSVLPDIVAGNTPMLGLIPEAESGLISATLLAADIAGFKPTGVAMRHRDRQAQITWTYPKNPPLQLSGENSTALESALGSVHNVLETRAEPMRYLPLHTAFLAALANQTLLSKQGIRPYDRYAHLTETVERVFTYRGGFSRYEPGASLDVGSWWLQSALPTTSPLADRVEVKLTEYLSKHPGCTFSEIDRKICQSFPGFETPERELVVNCLESYGRQNPPESGSWALRPDDMAGNRTIDLQDIKKILHSLGHRLGFQVQEADHIRWIDHAGDLQAVFFLQTSAELGHFANRVSPIPGHCYIVLPGSRANLVAFKIQRNPYLKHLMQDKWRFIKFRHIRSLSKSSAITLKTMGEQFALDPLTYTSPQMQLLQVEYED